MAGCTGHSFGRGAHELLRTHRHGLQLPEAEAESEGEGEAVERKKKVRASKVRKSRVAAKVRRKGTTSRRARAPRVTYVWRYNPDSESGRAVRVRSDSPEASSWPTSKRGRLSPTARREITRSGERIAAVAVPAALGSAKAGAVAIRAAGAAAGIGATATTALVVAAFGVGYAIGTGLRALWEHMQPEERDYRKALAFRKARDEFARQHGRPMSAAEVRAMGRGFLESLSVRR